MTRDRFVHVSGIIMLGLALAACGQETAEAARRATGHGRGGGRRRAEAHHAHRPRRVSAWTSRPPPSRRAAADGEERLSIPYGAVVWDADGGTWAYTAPEPLVFLRAEITLDRIDGDQALLLDGPDPGTEVVIVGAAELWGTEHGVGGSGH